MAAELLGDISGYGPLYSRPTNWWNLAIDEWPIASENAALQAAAIADADPNTPGVQPLNEYNARAHPDFNALYGFAYDVVDYTVPLVNVVIEDLLPGGSFESDPGPYPVPAEAKTNTMHIENGSSPARMLEGDRHMLFFHRENRILYELAYASWNGQQWTAGYGAIFDLKNNSRRPEGNTSTDAAGLAVLPGLIRYDEIMGPWEIEHALRFALKQNNGYVWPASHDNHVDYPGAPPLGARIRLNAAFDTVNKVGGGVYSAPMQKVLRALKIYGGILADRGGGFRWMGTLDTRWATVWPNMNSEFHTLHLSDFEFTKLGDKPPVGSYRRKIVPSEL